jgi:hypothetical protein
MTFCSSLTFPGQSPWTSACMSSTRTSSMFLFMRCAYFLVRCQTKSQTALGVAVQSEMR